MRAWQSFWATNLFASFAIACTGQLGAQGDFGQTGGGGPGATEVSIALQKCSVGPSPMRRLSRFEYNQTIADLLGDTSEPANSFPAEQGGNGFGNDSNATAFAPLLAEEHLRAAQIIAKRATASQAALSQLVNCGTMPNDDCAKKFIVEFGRRAFRRPLEDAEVERLLAVYKTTSTELAQGIEAVMTTMLISPQYLYRVETGASQSDADGTQKLSGYEMASRLSYLIWGSMPDAELFAAAEQNKLSTPIEIRTQAERMLSDGRAHRITAHFHELLFKLAGLSSVSRDTTAFPNWKPGLGALLAQEASMFIDHVVWNGEGNIQTLLTAPYTFMNKDLADFYQVAGNRPSGSMFERVDLDPSLHTGFMTQAGAMTLLSPGAHTNPVKRGYFIRERLLCDPPPSPPPTVNATPPEPDPTLTTRESFRRHSEDPACSGCHKILDPLGFAFENYDNLGLWRTHEHGMPIDTQGELVGTDVDGSFKSARELMERISRSGNMQRCYVKNWFRFGLGRVDTEQDQCSVDVMSQIFGENQGDIRELIMTITQTKAFLSRTKE